MLGVQGAHLGPGPMEQTLSRQTAASEGQEAVLHVPALIQALGIDGAVENHQNPVFLIGFHQVGPDIGHHRHNTGKASQEPPQLHAAGEGHGQEDKHENQGNTGVAGDDHVEAHQENQMEGHGQHGFWGRNAVPVGLHDLCQQDGKGDLADFGGLDVDRKKGEVQPAFVAGVVIGAEGNQEQNQQSVKQEQKLPPLPQGLHADAGQQNVE